MGAIVKNLWMLMIIPAVFAVSGCKQNASYASDNKKRAKHLAALKARYEEPGQTRVKTGNINDGF
jgi:hypothetical protein